MRSDAGSAGGRNAGGGLRGLVAAPRLLAAVALAACGRPVSKNGLRSPSAPDPTPGPGAGATTLGEYRKHVEKDPALERRFQPAYVAPISHLGRGHHRHPARHPGALRGAPWRAHH